YGRFKGRSILCFEYMCETAERHANFLVQTEDSCLVFSHTFGELFIISITDIRLCLHNYSRLCSFDACFPGTFMTSSSNFSCSFSKVPDITLVVLCKPVICRF